MKRVSLAAVTLVAFIGPACKSSSPASSGSSLPGAQLKGVATVLGPASNSGTTVAVAGSNASTTTAADGSWTLTNVPTGVVTLNFSNGPFQWTLTDVVALPGGTGFVASGDGLWPLVPMDVPRGTQLAQGEITNIVFDMSGDIATAVSQDPAVSAGEPAVAQVFTSTGPTTTTLEKGASVLGITSDLKTVVYSLPNPTPPSTSGTIPPTTVTLKSVPVAGTSAVVLSTSAAGADIVLSPDGSTVIFLSPQNPMDETAGWNLNSEPITGGTPTTLLMLTESGVEDPYGELPLATFTPDSKNIVLCTDGSLEEAPVDGSTAATVITMLEESECDLESFTIVPGNTLYALYSIEESIYVVGLSSGATPSLVASEAGLEAISPDGTWLAVSGETGSQVVPIASGGNPVTLATDVSNVLFTPDSQNVLFVSAGSAINEVNLSSGLSTTLTSWTASTTEEEQPVYVLALSTDGKTLCANTGPMANTIVAITLGSSATPIQLTDQFASPSGGFYPEIYVSPDGSRAVYLGTMPTPSDMAQLTPVLFSVPTAGGTSTPLQLDGSWLGWVDNTDVYVERYQTPAPYGLQDGLYKVPIP